MAKLLSRPKQYSDECIVSYLIRVSELNDFTHIGYLLKFAGLSWKNHRGPLHQIITGEYPVKKLISNLGLVYNRPTTASVYDTFVKSMSTPYVFVKSPKVCPACLQDEGYSKHEWSFLSSIACPKHRLMLIDENPISGARLSWYRSNINKFHRSDLHNISVNVKASKAAIEFTQMFNALAQGNLPGGKIPKLIEGLTFAEVLTILNFLTHYQLRLSSCDRFAPASFDNLSLAKHYLVAWKTIRDWPNSFHSLLSQYIDSPMSNQGSAGINKHFRDIHERLHKQQSNNGIARIKHEFDTFIELSWPAAISSDRISRIKLVSNERRLITRKEAAKILECRPVRVGKLNQQQRLAVTEFKGKIFYQREEVENLAKLIRSNWSLEQACEELEISRYQMKKLIDAEFIEVLQRPNKLNRDWLILKQNCIDMVIQLRKLAKASKQNKGYSLGGIQRQGMDINTLLKNLLNKEISFRFTQIKDKPYSLRQLSDFTFVN